MPIDPITPEESANRRNIRKAQASIQLEIDKVIETVFASLSGAKLTNSNFRLADNPRLLKKVNESMKNFRLKIDVIFVNSLKGSFETSQANLINTVYKTYDGRAIIDPVKDLLKSQYDEVLQAFLNRSVNGLGLSDRLWQLTYQFQREIEWTVFAGLSEGQSAQTMSRSMKRFLKNPDSLFRRVRNAKGKLVLSANAKKFNPGQGVYRSSYKNSMRLARTEINTAYRTADHEQYKNKPYVLGIEVKLSPSHPIEDYCDYLVGIYPSWFKFTQWHIQCLCFAIPVLADKDQFNEYQKAILAGTEKDFKFNGVIESPPDRFFNWIEGNKERLNGWKHLPPFLKDNPRFKKLLD